MPLERKILLTVLVAIILIFTGYFLHSTYYTKYIDTKEKIEKYKKLLEGLETPGATVSDTELNRIQTLIDDYTKMFFTNEESIVTNITPDIKSKLEKSGINIKQYENSSQSVRYVIDGSKTSLLNFLNRISRENKNYKIPIFNIRMIDNQNFQGVLEISKPVLKNEPNSINYKKEVATKTINPPYYSGALAPLGVNFEVIKEEPKEEVVQEEVIEQKVFKTDKFTFVGLLKSDLGETTTLFKESVNGRVFKFKEGESLSGWTYVGERDGKYIMKKDDIEYEVTP